MSMFQHEGVMLHGGPCDGALLYMSPLELATEIRFSTVDRTVDPPQMCEHFYMVSGALPVDADHGLEADHVSTLRFNLQKVVSR